MELSGLREAATIRVGAMHRTRALKTISVLGLSYAGNSPDLWQVSGAVHREKKDGRE